MCVKTASMTVLIRRPSDWLTNCKKKKTVDAVICKLVNLGVMGEKLCVGSFFCSIFSKFLSNSTQYDMNTAQVAYHKKKERKKVIKE